MTETIKLSDLQPDDRNANKGSERGTYMIRRSLEKLGAGRSILLDKNGRIIAGNKTAESAADVGLDDVIVVRTQGRQLVAVLREDLDLDDPAGMARELAYADNRTGQVSLDWDAGVLAEDIAGGVDLSDWFKPYELNAFDPDAKGDDPNELWKGMPEFEQEDKRPFRSIIIHFATLEDVGDFSRTIDQKITDKTKSIWHPYKPHDVLKNLGYRDES